MEGKSALPLSPSHIGDIVLERRGITADTAMRLARHLGGTAQFCADLAIYIQSADGGAFCGNEACCTAV